MSPTSEETRDAPSAFAAAIGSVGAPDAPGLCVGLEHEFVVAAGSGQIDFRRLLPTLDVPGSRLDPGDPNAYRLESGLALTCDGPEAEYASPPIELSKGFPGLVEAWSRSGGEELLGLLPPAHDAEGWSTHLSVTVPDRLALAVGGLFARTFAPALMLLMDGQDSPGLLIRPRHNRVEFGGDFVTGPALRAATALAVGGVLACTKVAAGAEPRSHLPPPVGVEVEAALDRYGWYVDRTAFGFDLYRTGRTGTFKRQRWGSIPVQLHLTRAWLMASRALASRVGPSDLAAGNALVEGRLPLPSETDRDRSVPTGPRVTAAGMGRMLLRERRRPRYVSRAVAATWDFAVFRLAGARSIYASVPQQHVTGYVRAVEGGALDAIVGRRLEEPRRGRILETHDQTLQPALWDEMRSTTLLAAPERGADGVPRPVSASTGAMGAAPGSAAAGAAITVSSAIVDRPGKGPVAPPPFVQPGGFKRWWPWLAALLVAVVAAVWLTGGGEPPTIVEAPLSTTVPVLDAATDEPQLDETTTSQATVVPTTSPSAAATTPVDTAPPSVQGAPTPGTVLQITATFTTTSDSAIECGRDSFTDTLVASFGEGGAGTLGFLGGEAEGIPFTLTGTVLTAELETPIEADPGTVVRELVELDLAAGTGTFAFVVIPPEAGLSCYDDLIFDPITIND